MIPCRECLVKPMCRLKLRKGVRKLYLECPILDKWLDRNSHGNISLDKIDMMFKELSIVHKGVIK